jgi:excisionase family DNA binding protein
VLLTVKDVAHVLDVHPHTIRRAIKAGAIVSVRVGRHIRIPRDVAVAILQRGWRR